MTRIFLMAMLCFCAAVYVAEAGAPILVTERTEHMSAVGDPI